MYGPDRIRGGTSLAAPTLAIADGSNIIIEPLPLTAIQPARTVTVGRARVTVHRALGMEAPRRSLRAEPSQPPMTTGILG